MSGQPVTDTIKPRDAKDVEAAIANLARLGVRLKIITGDNRRVAEHVAHMVSLPVAGEIDHFIQKAG